MRLFHVSKINKEKQVLDMSIHPKNDIILTGNLIGKANSFQNFYDEYQSQMISDFASKKEWTKEKIATEAVFEYIRKKSMFNDKPTRLENTYFNDSINKAKEFNEKKRNSCGAIFSFDAEKDKVFYFNMDLFDLAYRCFHTYGVDNKSFDFVKKIANKYWNGSEKGHVEIIYLGYPTLYRIDEEY